MGGLLHWYSEEGMGGAAARLGPSSCPPASLACWSYKKFLFNVFNFLRSKDKPICTLQHNPLFQVISHRSEQQFILSVCVCLCAMGDCRLK